MSINIMEEFKKAVDRDDVFIVGDKILPYDKECMAYKVSYRGLNLEIGYKYKPIEAYLLLKVETLRLVTLDGFIFVFNQWYHDILIQKIRAWTLSNLFKEDYNDYSEELDKPYSGLSVNPVEIENASDGEYIKVKVIKGDRK